MTIRDGFPSASGTVDPQDLRYDLAGLIVRDTAGLPRAGVFPRHADALVNSRSDLKVDVLAFEAAAVRGSQGPVFIANDGTVQVTIPTAPVANSRYDIVYAKQNDSVAPNADANSNPILGVYSGAASPSPSMATAIAGIPAGALPLAAILLPTGKTATNQSGVVITQIFPYTCASGGVLWFRTDTERDAFSAENGQIAFLVDDQEMIRRANDDWGSFSGGYLHVREEQAANTEGGSATAGSWTKRTLNQVKTNSIAGASLASSQITLGPGRYRIAATAPAYGVNGHKTRLRKVSGTQSTLLVGKSAFAQTAGTDVSVPNNEAGLVGEFVLTTTSDLELQHRVESSLATYGFGRRSNVAEIEVFAEVEIWKVA